MYFIKTLEKSFIVPGTDKELIMSRFFVVTNELKLYIYETPLTRIRIPVITATPEDLQAEQTIMTNPSFSMYREKIFFTEHETE